MINRPDYINAIKPFMDQPIVKILAGIRRGGKSTIFDMVCLEFERKGISKDCIIYKKYTEMDIPSDITAKQMYDELMALMKGKERCYVLLDEAQEVPGWEKAVNGLLEGGHADIYVTGSNSKLMSSEISTYLTGRYVLIPVYPLSFREYVDFKGDRPLSKKRTTSRIHSLRRVSHRGFGKLRSFFRLSNRGWDLSYGDIERYRETPCH